MFSRCILILVTPFGLLLAANVETIKQWTLLTYNLPAEFPADNLEFNNPRNVVATGFVIAGHRLFLATPRLFSGVPATLSSVPLSTIGDSPILNVRKLNKFTPHEFEIAFVNGNFTKKAYPNWHHHLAGRKLYNCSEIGLVSVYRIRIDSCNRLWALDAGVSRSFEDSEVTCPPKILVFDLKTNHVVRRIDFPSAVIKGDTLFTNMIIDETTSRPENNCNDVYVYITDTIKPAIVVYDSTRGLTWRLTHPAMYPDPNFSKSNILGHRFTLMDGIVGLALDSHAKIIYFQPLATDRLFSIKTSVLRAGPSSFGVELPVNLVGKKSSQGMGLAVSPIDGSIFFSPVSETAVAKWNPITNNQRFFLRNLEPTEINTRIMRINDNIKLSAPISAIDHRHSIPSDSVPISAVHQKHGILSETVQNPFLSFITTNGPVAMAYHQKRAPKYSSTRNGNYYNIKLGNFNGLKVTKMVSYNISTFH